VDRAVAGRLTQLLGEMEAASKQLIQVEGLEPTFSLLRLPRSDPAEQVLVRTLLRSEPDLEGYTDQPIAFPVFGRGRVLCALVGPGINAETVEEVCAFLVGPCSCLVKADNPGFDLVMRADWKRVPGVQAPTEGEPLPLVSLPDGSVLDSTFARVADMEGASRSGLAEGDRGGPLVAGALMALAAIAVAVALGTFMLRRAGGRRKPNAGP
jgi:hypothetical protein